MALPSFFLWGAWAVRVPYSGARSRDSRTVRGQEMSACFTQLSGVARELIPPQVAPENCSPPGAAGRMALPSFSMRGLGCADILPLAQKYGGEKISCLSHTAIRGRQRTASAAGGARELLPPQVVLSTKSLGGCIIMLSAAGGSRLLIPNKGVSRHEVFHLPCCI